ncbi:MAG: ferritin-like domain-containing protein [Burkholderiaceae bacterium]|jgi:uncharacterized ferritin-like protein (DUF455 family)|nr:ferritin-like domain-containing protein [Burkholderiaceae bacterium]
MQPSHNPRELALQALQLRQPHEKVSALASLWQCAQSFEWTQATTSAVLTPNEALPGRPDKPVLVHPGQVPTRSVHTLQGRAALLHAICHIEFNAINLALDAVWRYPNMPTAFYMDWLRVAYEESTHFDMLAQHLHNMQPSAPWTYGDFEAHDGLWAMCEKTAADITARMALVPRTLEARGLDATPLIQDKLRKVATPDALETVALLDIILRDEIGHVAIGNHWYKHLCHIHKLDPVAYYGQLVDTYAAPKLKPPFNNAARIDAGFTEAELAYLLA